MFQFSRFHYSYDRRQETLLDVSIEIPADQIVGVLGASASGKTTFLNVMGMIAPRGRRSGKAEFHFGTREYNLARPNTAAQQVRKTFFGFVPQQPSMLPNFNCRYNVCLPLLIRGVSESDQNDALGKLLDALYPAGQRINGSSVSAGNGSADLGTELRKILDPNHPKLPSKTSGGQQQRLSLLRAMIHSPRVIFADEPFSSLDPASTESVELLLSKWQKNSSNEESRGMILVSHNISSTLRLADKLMVIHEGKVSSVGIVAKSNLPGYPDAAAMERSVDTWIRTGIL